MPKNAAQNISKTNEKVMKGRIMNPYFFCWAFQFLTHPSQPVFGRSVNFPPLCRCACQFFITTLRSGIVLSERFSKLGPRGVSLFENSSSSAWPFLCFPVPVFWLSGCPVVPKMGSEASLLSSRTERQGAQEGPWGKWQPGKLVSVWN